MIPFHLFDEVLTAEKTVVLPGMEKLPMWPPRPDLTIIRIEASEPLIDKKRPFMYTLQNAFDGNPATSYVENTEDDLMTIKVICPWILKIAIINGYVQNETTYFNNNRVKSIASEWIPGKSFTYEKLTDSHTRYEINDGIMDYQIIEYKTNGYVIVSDIYPGEKYTDTCIAELNLYNEKQGWLFGGIDE